MRFTFTMCKAMLMFPLSGIFPTEEGKGIEIDIYRGQDKVCTVERDNEGKPLYVMAGKQTDIEIDFKNTQIKATVKVLPWGEVNQNTEI